MTSVPDSPPEPAAPATSSLARRCAHAFEPEDRRQGDRAHRRGAVQLRPADEIGVGAEVHGGSNGSRDYGDSGDSSDSSSSSRFAATAHAVLVDWSDSGDDRLLRVACDCDRFEDGWLCDHLWATLRAVDDQGESWRVPGERRLRLMVDPELSGNGERVFEPQPSTDGSSDPNGERAEPPSDRVRPVPSDSSWRRRVDAIAHTLRPDTSRRARNASPFGDRRLELWFQIDIAATLEVGELTLVPYQRRERRDGALGALKPLSLHEGKIPDLDDPRDRALAELLLALAPARPAAAPAAGGGLRREPTPVRSVDVPAALFDTVLPRLAATGRLGWWHGKRDRPDPQRRLAWDDGAPYRLALRLRPATEGSRAAHLFGELVRPGSEPEPVTAPVLLLLSGLAVFEDRIARYEAGDDFAWAVSLRQEKLLNIPGGELPALFGALGDLPALPPLRVDERLPVAYRSPTPRPVLLFEAVRGASRREPTLRGELHFDYPLTTPEAAGVEVENRRIGAADDRSVLIGPAAGADAARLLHRDGATETAAHRRLIELGARRGNTAGAYRFPADRFGAAVEALLDDGWRVEAQGGPLRKPGRVRLAVKSGVDWFDLSGGLDFDGQLVPLPLLLEAAVRGDDLIELEDGARGLLPTDWLDRFGALARLAQRSDPSEADAPEADDDPDAALRFLPSQTLLLDALLSATTDAQQAEVAVDDAFARLRDRLGAGRGLDGMAEPESFRGTLRNYQRQGLAWLTFLADVGLGGCLADDMGLGKTVQVLALLQHRKNTRGDRDEPPAPSLVVAPRSLIYNWLDEAERFTPGLRTLDYTGPDRKPLRRTFGDHDLVVTTYGTLRRDAAALREIPFDHVILDEAQAIKNAQSQTAKASRVLRARHRLVVTGTPVENHLAELGSLFDFLNPGMLGRSSAFQDLLATGRSPDGEDDGALEDLSRALGPFILRRTKAQVLPELPPKTEQTLRVTLPEAQRAFYDELRDRYRAQLAERIDSVGLKRSQMQVLEALLRLRQAACHPALVDPDRSDAPSAKLDALAEQLQEVLAEGHKALVFSQFTTFLALLRDDLDRRGVPYEYLDGSTRDRASRVERFQTDPDCKLFLISLKAGGTGLNLTAADYVYLLDPWWNPAVEAQAIDRTHRIGQERPVMAYRLIARDTVEEKILELQKSKRELAEVVLSGSGGGLRGLSADDLELLLS